METRSNEGGAQAAPRSGAPAPAPFLDKEGRNLPSGTGRGKWSKKQWMTRRAVLDRLSYWQANGYQCLWVTLTSSPASPQKRLRGDYQALRKRIGRDHGFRDLEYVCVDTREGHGVLHMIWAWKDPDRRKRASFYVPFEWLQAAWSELHGAFHVNVKRIGTGPTDAKRLSRYIVAQYCGDQNALVRLSQSRMDVPLARMRGELLRVVKGLPERYEFDHGLGQGLSGEAFTKAFNTFLWMEFREAWGALVRSRSCKAFGVALAWVDGELRRV